MDLFELIDQKQGAHDFEIQKVNILKTGIVF